MPRQGHCSACACGGQGASNIVAYLLQAAGLIVAILFGVWGILQWELSKAAMIQAELSNTNAKLANQLSIIDFCTTNEVILFYTVYDSIVTSLKRFKNSEACNLALKFPEAHLHAFAEQATCGFIPMYHSTEALEGPMTTRGG